MAYTTDLMAAWSSPYWTIPPDGEDWRRFGVYTGGGTNWNPGTIDGRTEGSTSRRRTPRRSSTRRSGRGRIHAPTRSSRSTSTPASSCGGSSRSPGDQWGYSTVQPVLLYDVKIGGKERRVVSVGTKEGTWWMYDAETGAPIHERVKLVNQIEHPPLEAGEPVTVYPSSLGGLNYSPSSYDPTTGYVINNQAETAAVLTMRSNAR